MKYLQNITFFIDPRVKDRVVTILRKEVVEVIIKDENITSCNLCEITDGDNEEASNLALMVWIDTEERCIDEILSFLLKEVELKFADFTKEEILIFPTLMKVIL